VNRTSHTLLAASSDFGRIMSGHEAASRRMTIATMLGALAGVVVSVMAAAMLTNLVADPTAQIRTALALGGVCVLVAVAVGCLALGHHRRELGL